jgi:hypothetical protein
VSEIFAETMALVDAIEKTEISAQAPFADNASLSSIAPRRLRSGPSSSGTAPPSLENAARAALDSHAGRTLTDAEWARTRADLLELVTILRGWDQKARNTAPGLGNVEALCQREP